VGEEFELKKRLWHFVGVWIADRGLKLVGKIRSFA